MRKETSEDKDATTAITEILRILSRVTDELAEVGHKLVRKYGHGTPEAAEVEWSDEGKDKARKRSN